MVLTLATLVMGSIPMILSRFVKKFHNWSALLFIIGVSIICTLSPVSSICSIILGFISLIALMIQLLIKYKNYKIISLMKYIFAISTTVFILNCVLAWFVLSGMIN